MQKQPMKRGQGQWQAYVEQGATKQIQYARLKLVPTAIRDQVIGHMRTVIKINLHGAVDSVK